MQTVLYIKREEIMKCHYCGSSLAADIYLVEKEPPPSATDKHVKVKAAHVNCPMCGCDYGWYEKVGWLCILDAFKPQNVDGAKLLYTKHHFLVDSSHMVY